MLPRPRQAHDLTYQSLSILFFFRAAASTAAFSPPTVDVASLGYKSKRAGISNGAWLESERGNFYMEARERRRKDRSSPTFFLLSLSFSLSHLEGRTISFRSVGERRHTHVAFCVHTRAATAQQRRGNLFGASLACIFGRGEIKGRDGVKRGI